MRRSSTSGFTLLEIIMVVTIIGILTTVIVVGVNEVRAIARDNYRSAAMFQLQLAIEAYYNANGFYPAEGCGETAIGPNDNPGTADWDGTGLERNFTGPGPYPGAGHNSCDEYIYGLVPDYIDELPLDPRREDENNRGFVYRVSPDGSAYKVMILWSVETDRVNNYGHPLARCPRDFAVDVCDSNPQPWTYAIYSAGAEDW